jgi:hypothetical protein
VSLLTLRLIGSSVSYGAVRFSVCPIWVAWYAPVCAPRASSKGDSEIRLAALPAAARRFGRDYDLWFIRWKVCSIWGNARLLPSVWLCMSRVDDSIDLVHVFCQWAPRHWTCSISCFFVLQMDVEKLKRMAGAVRTGGKGSMRRCFSYWLFTCVSLSRKLLARHMRFTL